MVGGMENLSFALAKEFQAHTNTTLITWGKSQKFLPFVLLLFERFYQIARLDPDYQP